VAFVQIGSDSRVVEEFKDRIWLALPHGMYDAAQTNGCLFAISAGQSKDRKDEGGRSRSDDRRRRFRLDANRV
jgi:hypothetical protein